MRKSFLGYICAVYSILALLTACSFDKEAVVVDYGRPKPDILETRTIRPVEGAGPPLFYNVSLDPQLSQDPAEPLQPVLQVGLTTTLHFDIGPKWPDSVTPHAVFVPPESLRGDHDFPFTIVLGCDFCVPDAKFKQQVLFLTKPMRSEEIHFELTPQPRKNGESYDDELHLVIVESDSGTEVARLTVPVKVLADKTLPSVTNSNIALPFNSSYPPSLKSPPSSLDVIIYAIEGSGPSVTFSIEPVSAKIKALLGPLALDANGKAKTFRSGILDTQTIDQTSAWAFRALNPINLEERRVAKLRANSVDATISKNARENRTPLSEQEANGVTAVLAAAGEKMYSDFFLSGTETSLSDLIEKLETAAANGEAPLRVKIITDRLSLPWQYLHPPGAEKDPKQFWGIRFSLSVIRANDGARRWRETKPKANAHQVLFAHYGTSSDDTVKLALDQIGSLKQSLPSTNVVPVYAGNDLITHLKSEKDAITGIFTFIHASSGAELEFGENDIVDSMDFSFLKTATPRVDQDLRYLAQGPLVFLNACETGPSLKLTEPQLASALFNLGATGIIVTEVSVWQTLGDEMARRVFAHLVKGDTAADALTAARRELLKDKNNPLGLLYAYYGDPNAVLLP